MNTYTVNFKEEFLRQSSLHNKNISGTNKILNEIVLWFIRIRWWVLGALFLCYLLLSFLPRQNWLPFISTNASVLLYISLTLLAANILYYIKRPSQSEHPLPSDRNLLFQIIVDLHCLYFFLYYTQTINTVFPFLCIMHIAISALFFPPIKSFLLFLYSVGVLSLLHYLHGENGYHCLAIIFIFASIWYLVSQIASILRFKDIQLLSAHDRIEKLQKEKSDNTLYLIHQLKSPLAAVGTLINLVKAGYHGPVSEKLLNIFYKIENRVTIASNLILDLMKFERIQLTKMDQSSHIVCDLKKLIQTLLDDFKEYAENKKVTLQSALTDFSVEGDKDQLEALFHNLISNGINYSKENGVVTISMLNDSHNCTITVSDEGIGIPQKSLPRIFDTHFRSPDAVKHNPQSTGIGLSIVKTVSENHDIHVTVKSEENKGTTFELKFPHQRESISKHENEQHRSKQQ